MGMKIEKDKNTIKQMVTLYCRHKLNMTKPNEEYQALIDYCSLRLDKCKWGEKKMACKNCPVHCYKPEMREKIRKVMIWAGPRMLLYNPIAAIKHLLGK
ncbi:MAG: nitrous oxide-stimulated promoter family protein [Prevotella sp.]|jgi:hypothetical protein|nr:nitrous oxide-stimulated promoter family protein [Prevotella sp.]MBP8757835.1 nitrous oxide-stimulated promoter family protein [Prevotella sp.]MBP9985503.1 nitrous oxide-stimulated promoter family protein [Prevotella sp.]